MTFNFFFFFGREISKCDWSVFKAFHMEETPATKEDVKQLWLSMKTDFQTIQIPWEGWRADELCALS